MIQLGLFSKRAAILCDGVNCGIFIREAHDHDSPDDRNYCDECSLTVCLDCGRQGCMCDEAVDDEGFVVTVLR